ncbi:prepilin-type N-terminal cleavage/methylation domain-containing protein [Zoogloea sp.]|uniref:pilin n=1 Tax=Zoogloea sp. TaxID=49181 RepID=UPI0035ADE4E5
MKKQGGFTLIELMIVVAIIGILAAIAVPQYQQFQRKAKFSDVVSQTAAYKSAVELCIQNNNGKLTGCDTGAKDNDGGTWSIPDAIAAGAGKGNLDSLSAKDGVITAAAKKTGGLDGETYVLTPVPGTASITWATSGTCRTASPPIC